MKAIIVGHGPSIMGEKMGHLIDEYDVVIRLKRCQETLKMPEYFGTKTDIVGGSMTIAGGLREIAVKNGYWVFLDSRHENLPDSNIDVIKRIFKGYGTVHINQELCDEWDALYREARTDVESFPSNMDLKHKSCDERGERHLSQGFKAILYACTYIDELTQLTLVGFDNIMLGEFNWSITRGPDWTHYPPHRWDIEHKLLKAVEDTYGVEIGYLLPEQKEEVPDGNKSENG